MMTRLDRAKQFAPFDAMKGLQEALREREHRHIRQEKKELTQEMCEEISAELALLERGDQIEVVYYANYKEVCRTGKITDLDSVHHFILLGTDRICFEDIYLLHRL